MKLKNNIVRLEKVRRAKQALALPKEISASMKPRRLICSVCRELVDGVFENGRVDGRVVVGPHTQRLTPDQMVRNKKPYPCAGVGKLGI